MSKIFITVKRELAYLPKTDEIIKKWERKGTVTVFARQYSFKKGQEKEMMRKVKKEIADCDSVVVIGDNSIGVGIEIGIAYALGKKIIIEMDEVSATLKGVES